jgi:hypothetical protein
LSDGSSPSQIGSRIDPQLMQLLMACRWPLALVLSTWAAATAAIVVLKQPIPIALPLDRPLPVQVKGALHIQGIDQTVAVRTDSPLAVAGTVNVGEAVSVQAASPLPVLSSQPLEVDGAVAVKQITQPVVVEGINKEIAVEINNEEPLEVSGNVAVEEVGGRINVTLRNAVQSLSPIPLP